MMGDSTAVPQRSRRDNPHAAVVRTLAAAMLRTAVWPAVVAVALGAVVATALIGLSGLWGALIGGAIAVVSSLATIWLMRLTGGMDPHFVMGAAFGGYLLKVSLLLVVMTLLGGIAIIHRESLAFTMLGTLLVWTGAEVVAFRRTRLPVIVPEGGVGSS